MTTVQFYSTVYSPVIGVQFTVSSRIQDTFWIFSRVKHIYHIPLLLLLPDPGLPAGLEAAEEGQDLGQSGIFIS